MRFWEKLDRYPPVLVRLLARTAGGEAMTDAQIAYLSELSIAEIRRLSFLTSWDDVKVDHVRRFMRGCNIDLTDRDDVRNANRYLKRGRFEYLRRHENWPEFQRMLEILSGHLSKHQHL